ncbi:putative 2OG-Fe(II) oxygenase [Sphingomonas adhaesiva]|uniref:putative 2OG-Fe(II) oxygenase n=1 Tax=Sphingomonas adhaesiva TaxID=28212 RepID=UPI002FF98A30
MTTSAIAEHNLAARLGDAGDFAGAIAACARAIALGGTAPETYLVQARALQGLHQLDEAEAAYAQAIARRADYAVAHRDLAQLRWMRSGDARHAMAMLDRAPDTADLALVRATVLTGVGEVARAAQVLDRALDRAPDAVALRLAAAGVAGQLGRASAQLDHATAALRAAPASIDAARAAVEALLHLGRIGEAAALAERVVAAAPNDQAAIALMATAWRLAGDARHAALCEDPALVRTATIATPAGWRDLPAYLADLATALDTLHGWRTHPLEQSIRHGSQTQVDLSTVETPVIAALFAAFDAPIRAHIAALGAGGDPVRRRARGGYRIAGAWSVRLMPGGFHTDHVHPAGWLSSAFYVALPDAVATPPQGWLAFGRPGGPTVPALAPFRHVRPEPGMLALFPSYLWHGTEPFTGDAPRLTVAFDLVPA